MRKSDEKFKILGINDLPTANNSINCGSDFFICDTFGLNIKHDSYINVFTGATLPFKVDYTQIVFCTGGMMRVRVNMKEMILTENNVLLITRGSLGELLEMSDDFSLAMVGIKLSNSDFDMNAGARKAIFKFLMTSSLLNVPKDEFASMISTYHLMKRYAPSYDTVAGKEIVKKLCEVLYLVLSEQMQISLSNMLTAKVDRQTQLFERFISEVQANYQTQREVGFYADKLCVSQKYLSHVVHSASGKKASEWIRSFVILEAKVLLRSHKYTVQQISDMLNFPNPSFFGVYFKRFVGCSPKTYQNS